MSRRHWGSAASGGPVDADGILAAMGVMEEMWPNCDTFQVVCITILGESVFMSLALLSVTGSGEDLPW